MEISFDKVIEIDDEQEQKANKVGENEKDKDTKKV